MVFDLFFPLQVHDEMEHLAAIEHLWQHPGDFSGEKHGIFMGF